MKVAFVVPRYGPAIIGGAETGARLLAEHLVSGQDWPVEVLTGCAEDFVTWDEVYPEGRETVNGVSVVRLRAERGRDPSFHPFSAGLLADPGRASLADAERWIDLQGPKSSQLVTAAVESDADVVVFYPYLYFPTVRAIGRTRAPAVLHPAAHDEPALYLPVFDRVLAAPDGFVFQTEAERDLVQRRVPMAATPQLLLGLGVDDPDVRAPTSAADAVAVPDAPYLICLGRVDRQKGVPLLVELFGAYKARHPGPLRLVVVGPVVEPPPSAPEVDLLGPVDDDAKWALLSGALALVSPSPWEAFSLAVAEAWSARTPVLVHAGCGATVEHCRRSGGGASFAGFGEFEALLDRLGTDPDWARRLGRRGRAYVDARFRWPHVIGRYARFLERVADAGPRFRRVTESGAEDHHKMPLPSGRGPARATTGTPSTAAPGPDRIHQAR